jgi:2-oxoglutarate/2-oxoacid ferredoxin oxidoreductase subunit alpha
VDLVQLAFSLTHEWRNPVLIFGDYYLAHTAVSVDLPDLHSGRPASPDWALDGSSGGTGRAKLISPLGTIKQRDDVGYDLSEHYLACARETARMLETVQPLVETEGVEDAEFVVTAFGTPAKYVRAAVRSLRRDGHPIGFIRPISLVPFPTEVFRSLPAGVRRIAVYENNTGQMVDDVRLAVADRVDRIPVEFIGGLSLDSSGFGIAPDLDVARMRQRIAGLLEAAA